MQEIYLTRQPIYNQKREVAAFELLYRHSKANHADFADSDVASSRVILNALSEMGLGNVVDDRIAFINVSRHFIIDGDLAALPSQQLVFEIVGDITIDIPLLVAMRESSSQGKRFALDDYEDNEANRALLDVVSYIEIDMLTTPAEEVRRLVPQLRQHKVALIAKRIEDQEMLTLCQSLGFDYLQGYHFSRPQVLKFRSIPTSQISILQLISKLSDQQVDLKAIESLITQDVSLSYKLLRYINSSYFGLNKRVESIRRAMLLLGLNNIKSWAILISMANIDEHRSDLITAALVRAKMCELLAKAAGLPQAENGFTVGLLSILDTMTQAPMEEVLAHLPLTDEINDALLRHEGLLGRILACTLAYEQADWQVVDASGFDADQVSDAYFVALSDAYRSAFELMSNLPAGQTDQKSQVSCSES